MLTNGQVESRSFPHEIERFSSHGTIRASGTRGFIYSPAFDSEIQAKNQYWSMREIQLDNAWFLNLAGLKYSVN